MNDHLECELSIIIPSYNESKNLNLIFEKLSLLAGNGVEVILVNNGSTDDSATVIATLLTKYQNPGLKVVNVVKNQGYGYGILCGLEAAKGKVLSWTHADLQTDPKDIMAAFELYKSAKAKSNAMVFVKGHRINRRLAEAFFSYAMGLIASVAIGVKLKEVNAQPKLFAREFFQSYLRGKAPHDFSLDLFALYQANLHCHIIQIPVRFTKRLHGEAKGGGSFRTRLKLIDRTFKYILKLRKQLRNPDQA